MLASIDFAFKLKEKRIQQGLSHKKLSEELCERYGIKISRDSLINYETSAEYHSKKGKNLKMNITYLWCLADYFGVSTDWFLGKSNVETPNADIRAVNEYTHLSEKAINALENPDVYNFINALFDNGLEENIITVRQYARKAASQAVINEQLRDHLKDAHLPQPEDIFSLSPSEEWYIEQIQKKFTCIQDTTQNMYEDAKELSRCVKRR